MPDIGTCTRCGARVPFNPVETKRHADRHREEAARAASSTSAEQNGDDRG